MEAAASYRRALALKPDYIEACFNLGILLQILGKPGEAEVSFRKVLALKPDFVGALNNLGLVLQAQDKPEEAEAKFESGLLTIHVPFEDIMHGHRVTIH